MSLSAMGFHGEFFSVWRPASGCSCGSRRTSNTNVGRALLSPRAIATIPTQALIYARLAQMSRPALSAATHDSWAI